MLTTRYDFTSLEPFLDELRAGADLVMGNRFEGGIEPGAMPASHRYLGNPVLSRIGRLFFHTPIGDFHCGLRGFRRDRMLELGLTTTGMEFASEMVVKSALAGLDVRKSLRPLSRDGRSRPPHLNTWRDGWRHLRFLLVYSPSWLYLYPGVLLVLLGIVGILMLFGGHVRVGGVTIGVHTFLAACMALLIGLQAITFSIVARRYASQRGLLPVIAISLHLCRDTRPTVRSRGGGLRDGHAGWSLDRVAVGRPWVRAHRGRADP